MEVYEAHKLVEIGGLDSRAKISEYMAILSAVTTPDFLFLSIEEANCKECDNSFSPLTIESTIPVAKASLAVHLFPSNSASRTKFGVNLHESSLANGLLSG